VVLPDAQPRARRVHQLRRGLRRHGTLLRVDPFGGCTGFAGSTNLAGGTLKSGSVTALAADDTTYYQVNPKTTTRPTSTTAAATSLTVASAAGFPLAGTSYVRIDNEVLGVTGGQGTTTWTVTRGQLGTAAATHAANATVTALATDWYAGFTGVRPGGQPQGDLQGRELRHPRRRPPAPR